MAGNVKISDLPSAGSTLNTTDTIVINQSGITKKSTAGDLTTTMTGFTQSGTGAVARTLQSKLRDTVSVTDFGVKGDGTDESTTLQSALTAVGNAGGGTIYFPVPTVRYQWATGLTVPTQVYLMGAGKFSTVLRYTGTGSGFAADGTNNVNTVGFSDFTMQCTANNAIAFDYSRFWKSYMRAVRLNSVSGTGQKSINANITNTLWTAFWNEFFDVYMDGAWANAVYLDSSVAQQANRWKFFGAEFDSVVNAFNLVNVAGFSATDTGFDSITGTAITTGASAQRIKFNGIDFECSAGTLFAINAATNRFTARGAKVFAGAYGTGAGLGTRADIDFEDWDQGHLWSGAASSSTVALQQMVSGVGIQHYGLAGLSSTQTGSLNLCGVVSIADANTSAAVTFANAEADASYRIAGAMAWQGGTPASGSEAWYITNPLTSGFTVNVRTAPGAGNTVQFQWHLLR